MLYIIIDLVKLRYSIFPYISSFQTFYMAHCICVMPPADRSRPGTANICIAKPCQERQGLVRKRQSVNKDNKENT